MKKYVFLLLFFFIWIAGSLADSKKDFKLAQAVVTPRVLAFIKENYIDQSRINPSEMLKQALNQVQKSAAEILVAFEPNSNNFTVTINQAVKKFTPGKMANLADLWSTLKEVYSFIEIHYQGTVDQQDIEYLAIDGMLNTLDPHSNILTPKIFNEFKIGTKGKFGGIGIVIGSKEGNLTVISPIEGTPAWKAGIKSGDKIIQIGEESTVNMSLTEAVELLRGDVGTNVTVTIERTGKAAPFNVVLKRAIINIESIQSAIFPVDGKSVGYIKIKNFQEDTERDFSKQLAKIDTQGISGLVLDLRNNPGGLLNQAVEVVDKFISSGVIVSTIGAGNAFIDQESAKGLGTEPDYPIVVIVNEGSASASEIVSGTLQSYKRAVVIGSQTFGKGSVQTVYDLRDGSGLKLTIAEYLTAGKNSIQSVGVIPNVALVPEVVDKQKMSLVENEHETEGTLEGHLNQYVVAASSKSDYILDYLKPSEKEDEDAESKRDYSKPDINKDIAIQIATRIIAGGLGNLRQTVEKINKEEDEKITAAMTKHGIDWSNCSSTGKPQLQVLFSLDKKGQPLSKVVAGEEVNLTLTTKNIGTGDFCRLLGVSVSKEFTLKNKNFVFGKVSAGETKKWSNTIKVPLSLVSQNLPFSIKFQESGSNQPAEFNAILPIEGVQRPLFSYNFKIGEPTNIKVKQNSIPTGKTIPLIFDIKNVGKGAGGNVTAIIKNAESNKGVFIDTGRTKIGKIEPGQTKQAIFKFKLEPTMPKNSFELEFTILDQDTYASLTKKIEINAGNATTEPKMGQWYEPPKISIASATFPIMTSQAKHRVTGTINDEQQVKDYFIFVGEDKVAYASNPNQSATFDISAELPLKDGNNLVSIFARDNQDMMSRSTFMIEKK